MCGAKGQETGFTRTKGPVMAPCAAVGTQLGECVWVERTPAECSWRVFEAPGRGARELGECRLQD